MDWHARFLQQAGWTAQLRSYLLEKAGVGSSRNLLELGCGTGALLADFPSRAGLYGLDVSLSILEQAAAHAPSAILTCGNGLTLPFAPAVFDLVFCHFVLLWVSDPLQVVSEMRRVTHPGGAVLALAEPDYGGRIDYPPELAELGRWQTQSLREQGADIEIGRKLAWIFNQVGIKQVESGVLGGEWKSNLLSQNQDLEWQVLQEDLSNQNLANHVQKMKIIDAQARKAGARILYVPTFYAWGIA